MSSISAKKQYRHRAREIALQLIYQLDVRHGMTAAEAFELFQPEEEQSDVLDYARELVEGVQENAGEIAELLRDNLVAWRPERMVIVDKAVISLALYEGMISAKVPLAVVISEAVELAKAFGTENSGRFVNGVLGRIARKGDIAGAAETEAAGSESSE